MKYIILKPDDSFVVTLYNIVVILRTLILLRTLRLDTINNVINKKKLNT